jgi:hypothetical protein
VDLATIAEHLGELVRVGGLVVARTESGFTLDDGTAIGRIQLGGDAAAFLELIEAGDALGIVGRVAAGPGGTPIIVATDPAGLVRLGSLGEMVPLAAEAGLAATPRGSPSTRASAGLGGPLGGLDGGWLGLVGVIVASAISLIVTVERRRRARRRLATVVAARLSELRRPFGRA